MQCFSQVDAVWHNGRSIDFSKAGVPVGGLSGKPIVTDDHSTKLHQSLDLLQQSKGAETEVDLSNEKECSIEGYNIIDVRKNVYMNSISSITIPSRQKNGKFEVTWSSDAVEISNQPYSQCEEKNFPSNAMQSKKD